ncbi:MAG: DUF488 family protein [Planctomycetes bacterium]|nr:DUF488 family protein [Planctomycetota bacterium]
MKLFGEHQARRNRNSQALAAFGVAVSSASPDTVYKTVRDGDGHVVYTVGYEGRDGDDLISRLQDAGVGVLVDIREKPFSRKPDFRRTALQVRCEDAGIRYESWTRLGSTEHQRDMLKSTGDIREFMRRFRDFAKRGREDELDALAKLAVAESIALLCYERCHEDCHRCVVADMIADRIGATVVAIM